MFRKFWKSIDGYKTVSGLVVTGIGGLLFLTPVTASYAVETVVTGVTMTIGGLAHKAVKFKTKQKEKSNGSGSV